MGYDFIDTDPRLVKTYKHALENGYDAEINNNEVLVKKICENCGEEFKINYFSREISFCSNNCALVYVNSNDKIKEKRTDSVNETYSKKGEETKLKQLKIYSGLKFKLKREPFLKEWENECTNNNVPFRLKTKYGYNSFKQLKGESEFFNHKVISVELDGFEDVYNGTVDEFHNFFSGGFEEKNGFNKPKYLSINQLQCGEIPLCPYDSCRLLALNLYAYVNNPFTSTSSFDFKLFKEHVTYAQRFMDDIVDLEIEKIDTIIEKIQNDPEPNDIKRTELELWYKIKDKAEQGRRTGLGITAEGDMLAALGYKYGTTDATDFSKNIHKTLAVTAYESSITMAKERGAFKAWDFETEINNPFIQRIWENLSDEYKEMFKLYGRRNISILTIAPTGTTSMMTQTTSGIEPVYLPAYMRRRKINPNDKSAKSSFIDEIGDHWEEYPIFHPKFKVWAEVNGHNVDELEQLNETDLNNLVKLSPYYGATANDVDWVEKVRMQGKIQLWVDHSISVTVNLPNSATEELVGNVYKTGWESGCKGITVYRDGSRSGVLVSKSESKKSNIFTENNAPKRTENLPCDVMRFTIKGEKWIGFLGLFDNRPYEIYSGLQEKVNIPSYIETGIIKKVKIKGEESRYDFIYYDKDGYHQEFRGLNRAFNREYWNVARMLSAILRHGMPLPNVMGLIDRLDFGESDITSWKNGIKRMLKKYIKDGTKPKGTICSECGSNNMIYKEGCITCLDCGNSKCE
jgi:ribonucleoside-diphosphate reductase alpha chain